MILCYSLHICNTVFYEYNTVVSLTHRYWLPHICASHTRAPNQVGRIYAKNKTKLCKPYFTPIRTFLWQILIPFPLRRDWKACSECRYMQKGSNLDTLLISLLTFSKIVDRMFSKRIAEIRKIRVQLDGCRILPRGSIILTFGLPILSIPQKRFLRVKMPTFRIHWFVLNANATDSTEWLESERFPLPNVERHVVNDLMDLSPGNVSYGNNWNISIPSKRHNIFHIVACHTDMTWALWALKRSQVLQQKETKHSKVISTMTITSTSQY